MITAARVAQSMPGKQAEAIAFAKEIAAYLKSLPAITLNDDRVERDWMNGKDPPETPAQMQLSPIVPRACWQLVLPTTQVLPFGKPLSGMGVICVVDGVGDEA